MVNVEFGQSRDIAGTGRATHHHDAFEVTLHIRMLLEQQGNVRQRCKGHQGDRIRTGGDGSVQPSHGVSVERGARRCGPLNVTETVRAVHLEGIVRMRDQRPMRTGHHRHV